MRQAVLAALDGLALIWGLAVGPFCWLLRDGLGPGSVDSHGAHAVARFLLTRWVATRVGAVPSYHPRRAQLIVYEAASGDVCSILRVLLCVSAFPLRTSTRRSFIASGNSRTSSI